MDERIVRGDLLLWSIRHNFSINAQIRMGVRLPDFTFWEEANPGTELL